MIQQVDHPNRKDLVSKKIAKNEKGKGMKGVTEYIGNSESQIEISLGINFIVTKVVYLKIHNLGRHFIQQSQKSIMKCLFHCGVHSFFLSRILTLS